MDNHTLALQIDAIRRLYSNQLSFIPLSTIENRYVGKNRVMYIAENDEVAAYLLHGSMKPGKLVVLTQVANKPDVYCGLQLFLQLRKKARDVGCSGIRVRCAEDVKVNWQALGFKLSEVLEVNNVRKRKILIWICAF